MAFSPTNAGGSALNTQPNFHSTQNTDARSHSLSMVKGAETQRRMGQTNPGGSNSFVMDDIDTQFAS